MKGDITVKGFAFSGEPRSWKTQGVRILTIPTAQDRKSSKSPISGCFQAGSDKPSIRSVIKRIPAEVAGLGSFQVFID